MPYFYNSINNIPVSVFYQISDSGDLSSLCDKRQLKNKLLEAWNKINQEIIDSRGIPANYLTILRFKKKALAEYEAGYRTGNRFHFTMARIAEAQAKEAQQGEEGDLMQTIASLSKFMGFRVDPNCTTLAEYFAYIDSAKKR